MDGRRSIGRLGEEHVADSLAGLGWNLLARNARTRYGEIDLIAREGSALVFVEVKTLRAGTRMGPATPSGSVTRAKAARIRRLAAAWLSRNGGGGAAEIRFDVVGVEVGAAGPRIVEHIRAAF